MTNKMLFLIVVFLFLIKIAALYFTNFNLFGDEAQYWLWSKNLDFGYYSKPPFLAWFIRGYTGVFGDSFAYLKILPIFVYFFTAWALYELCKGIGLNNRNSLSCSLIFLFIPAVSFSSFIISTDLFLLLFWTLALNELIKIKIEPDIKNFIFLGIFLGLAFLSKYAAIYFIICFFIYVLVDKNFRNIFLKNYLGFVISLVCAILILSPNIFWNLNNGWITLQHTSDNANLENKNINLYRGLEFVVIQILMLGPFLFLGSITKIRTINAYNNSKFLLAFSLPIFFIVFIEAVIVRANANWAAPALMTFFIFLYVGLKNRVFERLNVLFNFVFCASFFLLISVSYPAKIFDRVSGINLFAENVFSLGSEIGVKNFVISDRLLFASMNYQLREKNANFYMPYVDGSSITNHFMITSPLKKDMSDSFILIGSPNEINYLLNKFSLIENKTPKYNFTKKELKIYEVSFN